MAQPITITIDEELQREAVAVAEQELAAAEQVAKQVAEQVADTEHKLQEKKDKLQEEKNKLEEQKRKRAPDAAEAAVVVSTTDAPPPTPFVVPEVVGEAQAPAQPLAQASAKKPKSASRKAAPEKFNGHCDVFEVDATVATYRERKDKTMVGDFLDNDNGLRYYAKERKKSSRVHGPHYDYYCKVVVDGPIDLALRQRDLAKKKPLRSVADFHALGNSLHARLGDLQEAAEVKRACLASAVEAASTADGATPDGPKIEELD